MMSDRKNRKQLDDELLDAVSGGKITADGYSSIDSLIADYKQKNYGKTDLQRAIKGLWSSQWSVFSTTGTSADLQEVLNYIDRKW